MVSVSVSVITSTKILGIEIKNVVSPSTNKVALKKRPAKHSTDQTEATL